MAEQFVVNSLEWNYKRSNTIGGGDELYRTTVRSANVTCKACGSTWNARSGGDPGQYRELIGGLYIQCVKCPASGAVDIKATA